MDELEALEGIKRGLAAVEAGRVTPPRQFETEFWEKRRLPSYTVNEARRIVWILQIQHGALRDLGPGRLSPLCPE